MDYIDPEDLLDAFRISVSDDLLDAIYKKFIMTEEIPYKTDLSKKEQIIEMLNHYGNDYESTIEMLNAIITFL